MSDLANEFSWSWSRHRTFEECERRYWLNHYGAWGGWDVDTASAETREIYIQKNLNTRPQWKGSVVHEAVAWVLNEVRWGRFHEPERVVERYVRAAKRHVDDSQRKIFRVNPKKFPGFDEHYYDLPTEPAVWTEALAEIETLVAAVFSNPVFLRLSDVPDRIREVERLERLDIGGVPVWVSLDVLVEDGRGGFVVVDWKTGSMHDTSRIEGQLGVYAAYVSARYFNVPPTSGPPRPVDRIKTMYANLREGTREVFSTDEQALDRTLETIAKSAEKMRAKLRNRDSNTAEREDFALLPEGDPACQTCPFRRTCGRE